MAPHQSKAKIDFIMISVTNRTWQTTFVLGEKFSYSLLATRTLPYLDNPNMLHRRPGNPIEQKQRFSPKTANLNTHASVNREQDST